jgi:hypothetical protein
MQIDSTGISVIMYLYLSCCCVYLKSKNMGILMDVPLLLTVADQERCYSSCCELAKTASILKDSCI